MCILYFTPHLLISILIQKITNLNTEEQYSLTKLAPRDQFTNQKSKAYSKTLEVNLYAFVAE